MLEIFIFLQKKVNLEGKTRHAVITHVNTSNGIKIPTFFGKSWGMMLYLFNAPFSYPVCNTAVSLWFRLLKKPSLIISDFFSKLL